MNAKELLISLGVIAARSYSAKPWARVKGRKTRASPKKRKKRKAVKASRRKNRGK